MAPATWMKLKNFMLSSRSLKQRKHTLYELHLYAVLDQAKLVSGEGNHSRGYLWLGIAAKEKWWEALTIFVWVVVTRVQISKESPSYILTQVTERTLLLKKERRALASVAQLVGTSSGKLKGHGFDSWQGHMRRLWVQSPVGAHMRDSQSMFLSLCLSFLSPVSKINKHVLGCGFFKKMNERGKLSLWPFCK